MPSSVDPKVFRLPYTPVSEKDITVRKFTGSEDDHEPYVKWNDVINKLIENKVVNPTELDLDEGPGVVRTTNRCDIEGEDENVPQKQRSSGHKNGHTTKITAASPDRREGARPGG